VTFTLDGAELGLFDHPYNGTAQNERAVEIPAALQFIDRHGVTLEVGNVLAHYGITGHRVADRYEAGDGVENVDVFELDEPTESLVSISTIEHVRWPELGEREPAAGVAALTVLRELAGRLFVTVGLGQNPLLDLYLLHGDHGAARFCTLVRAAGGWAQTETPEWRPYGVETAWASSVWIGEW
jgi:hypothetical protein